MSRVTLASSAASHPPLSGIDEVSVPANAVLIFEHSALSIPKLYIHSGATAIKWAYHLNTQSTPTIGGEVIQVLSAVVGPITITGQTAGLKTNASGKIDQSRETKGYRNIGNRTAFSPHQELREIIAWFREYMTRAGSLTAGQQLRDEAAITFTYPERGWKFYIQVTKLEGFRYDREVISPEWSITAEVVSDNALDYFGGVTMNSFTDDLITNQQLLGQMGLSSFAITRSEIANTNFGQDGDFGSNNPFLNPAFSASGSDAAKLMGDNFKGLVAAWATGNFAHFGFGALLDNGFNQAQIDSTYQALFGTTFLGSNPGVGKATSGTAVYGGPANPTTKNQIVLDINSSFESVGIPGKVGVAVAMIESGLNPDRTQDGCTSPACGIGLFQTNGDGSGAAGGVSAASRAMVVKAGAQRVYESEQGNIISAYPTGAQISDATSWFSACQKRDYPGGLQSASNQTLGEFAQRAQGASDPAYVNKVIAMLPTAQKAITTAGGAAGIGGTLSGVRLAVINWAYKLVRQNDSTGRPTYSEGGRRDMENVTPADWGSVPLLDCSSSIALLYAWGTNKNHQYGLNNGSFNSVNTRTIWTTWRNQMIPEQAARAGDIIIFSPDANDPSNQNPQADDPPSSITHGESKDDKGATGDIATFNLAAYSSVHAEMFVEDFNGDSTLVFTFGTDPPTIGAFSDHKLGMPYKVFRILP